MFGNDDHNNSPDGAEGNRRKYNGPPPENNLCRPVTMRQLYTSENMGGDAKPVIDGREVDKVTVVGRIVSMQTIATGSTANAKEYQITDGTGRVIVKDWQGKTANVEDIAPNQWVMATGSVKQLGPSFAVIGSCVVIEDQNEVMHHFLESVLTHVRLTTPNAEQKLNAKLKENVVAMCPGYSAGLVRDRATGEIKYVRGADPAAPNTGAGAGSPSQQQGGGSNSAIAHSIYTIMGGFGKNSTFTTQQVLQSMLTTVPSATYQQVQAELETVARNQMIVNCGNDQWRNMN